MTSPDDFTLDALLAGDAKLLEAREFQIEEVCRAFHIPPVAMISAECQMLPDAVQQWCVWINEALRAYADEIAGVTRRISAYRSALNRRRENHQNHWPAKRRRKQRRAG